jgi:hypothetical protein
MSATSLASLDDDLDSDDLDSSDEGEEIKIDDVSSRSVTPSLPLKRRELDPEHAVASKKAPTIGKRSPAKPPKVRIRSFPI